MTEAVKNEVIQELDRLSADRLREVRDFVGYLLNKQEDRAAPPSRNTEAVERVRSALAHIPRNLSETIVQEREERV